MAAAPVITIDGPSGVGKGSMACRLAGQLGWHVLDSGALYRVVAHVCTLTGVELARAADVAEVARGLQVRFASAATGAEAGDLQVYCRDRAAGQSAECELGRIIRSEAVGRAASRIGAMPLVRQAVLQQQRDFCRAPGLVADGRDMGTVVFPRAALKFFLQASAQERAERRYRQLKGAGEGVNLARLLGDIRERDARDSSRAVSPLLPAADAIVIDTTAAPIDAVFAKIMAAVNAGQTT